MQRKRNCCRVNAFLLSSKPAFLPPIDVFSVSSVRLLFEACQMRTGRAQRKGDGSHLLVYRGCGMDEAVPIQVMERFSFWYSCQRFAMRECWFAGSSQILHAVLLHCKHRWKRKGRYYWFFAGYLRAQPRVMCSSLYTGTISLLASYALCLLPEGNTDGDALFGQRFYLKFHSSPSNSF